MPTNGPITCPYCGIITTALHLNHCPDAPELHARLAAALADSNREGYAISSYVYAKIARPRGLPAEITLKKHYGSWASLVAAFGLELSSAGRRAKARQPVERAPRQDEHLPCLHCGMLFRSSNLPRHERCCLHRPGLREYLRELVEDTPGCGCGIGLTDYRRRVDAWRVEQPPGYEPLPAAPTIHKYFPEWDDFLHWLGLLSEDEVIDAKTVADNARYRAEWQDHHAHELDSWGLPVVPEGSRYYRRILPNGGTATMIR